MLDNNDDNNDMAEDAQTADNGYTFVSADGGDSQELEEASEADYSSEPMRVRQWTLGAHNSGAKPDEDALDQLMDGLDEEMDADLKATLKDAAQMVQSRGVTRFECPVCGLGHSHGDSKHDIRRPVNPVGRSVTPGFDVTEEFAEQMKMNPFCHCGVNELAMLMDFYGYINVPVFDDQHKFEAVLEVNPDTLQDIMQMKMEGDNSPGGPVGIDEAVTVSGHRFDVDTAVYEELDEFYQRYSDIKTAADGAPIKSETRNRIEEMRSALEDQVSS